MFCEHITLCSGVGTGDASRSEDAPTASKLESAVTASEAEGSPAALSREAARMRAGAEVLVTRVPHQAPPQPLPGLGAAAVFSLHTGACQRAGVDGGCGRRLAKAMVMGATSACRRARQGAP